MSAQGYQPFKDQFHMYTMYKKIKSQYADRKKLNHILSFSLDNVIWGL